MQIITDIQTMRAELLRYKSSGKVIGFVPTMGALHIGHLALVQKARQASDIVVVSIFVNKMQFDREDDFISYPCDLQKDVQLLQNTGVDYIFAPDDAQMWQKNNQTTVNVLPLSDILLGKSRPGHFCGVTTIVAKLFNILEPHKAFFGEKDFQQLTIIRKMVDNLNFPIEIVPVEIVREQDGLACSSRNVLLTPQQRQAASILYKSLQRAQNAFDNDVKAVEQLKDIIKEVISSETLAEIERIDILDSDNLQEVQEIVQKGDVILLFVSFGKIQLLDQYIIK